MSSIAEAALVSKPSESSTRAKILEAAKRKFLAGGYGATSVEEIAAEAEVSKQTVYNHFGSKETLFRALIEELSGGLLLSASLPEGETGVRATLLAFARRFLHLALDPTSLGLHRLLVSETPHFPELARAVFEAGPRRTVASLAGWITAASRRGDLRVDNPTLAAEQLLGALRGHLQLRALFGVAPAPDAAEMNVAAEHAIDAFMAAYGR